MIQKLEVVINYEDQYIEITAEGASSTLHIEGIKPNPEFLGKAISNYLLKFIEDKDKINN